MGSDEKTEKPEETETPKEANLLPVVLIAIILLFMIFLWFSITETYWNPVIVAKINETYSQPEVDLIKKYPAINLTGIEIAKLSEPFIDTLQRPDGLFYFSSMCDGFTANCQIENLSRIQNGAWPLYAYSGLYRATGKDVYIDKIKNEMHELLNRCSADRDACAFIVVQIEEAYNITNDPRYLNLIIKEVETPTYVSEVTSSMLNSIIVRQQAMGYRLTGNEKYLRWALNTMEETEKSLKRFHEGETLYKRDNFEFRPNSCWFQLANIEMYDATKERKYLDRVTEFFDTARLGDYVKQNGLSKFNGVEIQPCIDSLLRLYERTGNTFYIDDAYVISDYYLNEMWDNPISKKYNGDYGFLLNSCRISNNRTICYTDRKALSDTSYAIYLFSLQKDKIFSIVKTTNMTTYSNYLSDPSYKYYEYITPTPINYMPYIVVLIFAIIVLLYLYLKKKIK